MSTARHSSDDWARIGRNELGNVTVSDSVVTKIAARAVLDDPDAGAAATRVLGRTVPGGSHLGLGDTDLDRVPKATVDVDGGTAFIDVTISVRWPVSIAAVTDRVRSTVITRVGELAGLSVDEVHITVADLVTDIPAAPRVR